MEVNNKTLYTYTYKKIEDTMHVNQKCKKIFSIFPHLAISKPNGNLNLMSSPFNTNTNSISY